MRFFWNFKCPKAHVADKLMSREDIGVILAGEVDLPQSLRYGPDKIKADLGCDAYLCYTDDLKSVRYWRGLFGSDDVGNPKGIVRLRNF